MNGKPRTEQNLNSTNQNRMPIWCFNVPMQNTKRIGLNNIRAHRTFARDHSEQSSPTRAAPRDLRFKVIARKTPSVAYLTHLLRVTRGSSLTSPPDSVSDMCRRSRRVFRSCAEAAPRLLLRVRRRGTLASLDADFAFDDPCPDAALVSMRSTSLQRTKSSIVLWHL